MNRTIIGALAIVITAVLLSPAAPVSAHADYDRSEPAKDAVVPEPPAQVDVYFTQEVFRQEGRNFVRVFDEQGQQVSEGDGVIDDDDRTHISAVLSPDLAGGRYIVRWMTTSDADGDTDSGAFCFYVAVEPTADQAAECAALEEDENAIPTVSAPTPTEPQAQPTETEAAPSPTTAPVDDTDDQDDDGGAPTGAIIGGIIAAAVIVIALGGGYLWMRRART